MADLSSLYALISWARYPQFLKSATGWFVTSFGALSLEIGSRPAGCRHPGGNLRLHRRIHATKRGDRRTCPIRQPGDGRSVSNWASEPPQREVIAADADTLCNAADGLAIPESECPFTE
jgi:hypothetical protein